jgi:prolyl oligopeptidase
MRRAVWTVLVGSLAVVSATLPETRKQPVKDVYHGVEVIDDYRWLEDGNDSRVREWSDAQNAYARSVLDKLPHVKEIRARVTEIMSAKTVSYGSLAYRQGMLFAIQREPPKEQPFLIVMSSPDSLDGARVLVDPNQIDKAGTTSIDWFVPSADGTTVAVSLSHAGTEAGDVHLFDTATGREVHEVVPRVNTGTAGGDLAWVADGSGFFYTRHPRAGERALADMDFYQQVYFHKLGTPTAEDRYELGRDFPRVAEIELEMHERSGTLLATVQNGDGGEFSHFLRSPSGKWTRLADFADKIVQVTFGPDEDLFLISRNQAPRGKILRLSLSDPDIRRAETIVPEGPDTIVTSFYHSPPSLLATESLVYAVYQLGGPTELRVFDRSGKRLPGPEQLPLSSAGGLTKLEGDDVLFANTSYVEPPAFHRFHPRSGKTEKTALATKAPVDFHDVTVVREFATSKDGTRVPINILFPKNAKQDGSNPALVTGYGGYGHSLTPSFNAVTHVLLEQGFVYAIANLRGGGEFGEPWHRQGNLTNKQNVFDDFAAVLTHLIARGYTSRSKLAIEGGSNGGLLMGATLVQHPDLMRAVVSHVGIYDMLRVELSPNGAFNVAEFGSVKDAEQFRALVAYSPYHHVEDGTGYPAVLFLTGANDPRVDPMQSRKMCARLQAATGSGLPVLLRTSSNSGHGSGTALSERIEQTVDVFAFLFDQLEIEYRARP